MLCHLVGLGTALPGDLSARRSRKAGLDTCPHTQGGRLILETSFMRLPVAGSGARGASVVMGYWSGLLGYNDRNSIKELRKRGGLLGGIGRQFPALKKCRETGISKTRVEKATTLLPSIHLSFICALKSPVLPFLLWQIGLLHVAGRRATTRPRFQLSYFLIQGPAVSPHKLYQNSTEE